MVALLFATEITLAIHLHTRFLEALLRRNYWHRQQGIALFRWKIPFIAVTTIGIGHLINAIIEAFADSYYTHGGEWSAIYGTQLRSLSFLHSPNNF